MSIEKLEYYWMIREPRVLKSREVAHILREMTVEETPSGSEGDVKIGYCGDRMQMWHYGGEFS